MPDRMADIRKRLLIFAKPLIAIFTTDAAVIAWGVRQMHWCIPLYFIYAHNQTLAGCLRGEGRTFRPMAIALFCVCGLSRHLDRRGSGPEALRPLWRAAKRTL
ncbi:MATE family efflux transporter [Pseudoramibacter alactolyticus]|uniref:MATE family efflux transporter n=1 Tax=Pseudoramibacter alactolyticus TaxID=113287 RepID=UPI0023523EFA|nr:MATE family efflux transporter [Pseudoramibacter alactolyticus]MBM6967398.1 hypothetical protein [Pseudoramibacter alactolyticus]